VQDIYLITDSSIGKNHVGKADGNERILGRWKNYASDGHGGNRALWTNSTPTPGLTDTNRRINDRHVVIAADGSLDHQDAIKEFVIISGSGYQFPQRSADALDYRVAGSFEGGRR
jgi:hypothetical protein